MLSLVRAGPRRLPAGGLCPLLAEISGVIPLWRTYDLADLAGLCQTPERGTRRALLAGPRVCVRPPLPVPCPRGRRFLRPSVRSLTVILICGEEEPPVACLEGLDFRPGPENSGALLLPGGLGKSGAGNGKKLVAPRPDRHGCLSPTPGGTGAQPVNAAAGASRQIATFLSSDVLLEPGSLAPLLDRLAADSGLAGLNPCCLRRRAAQRITAPRRVRHLSGVMRPARAVHYL